MSSKLIVVILIPCLAFAETPGDADVAREALRDGLWEIARMHVQAATNDETRLIVLESLAGEGRWDEISKRLESWSASAKGDAFDYYRAVLSNDHVRAAKLLERGGSVPGCQEARLHEADQLVKSGNAEAARAIWLKLSAATNASDRVRALASINLSDERLLRQATDFRKLPLSLRRLVCLRLGVVLLRERGTQTEGMNLIRAVVRDSPDTESATDAFLAMAEAEIAAERWTEAEKILREAMEIWPEVAKRPHLHENRGWAYLKLSRHQEALAAFVRMQELAADDATRALAMAKQGDVLAAMGRAEESMAKYRELIKAYPKTTVAARLRTIVEIRELEAKGREDFRAYRFEAAAEEFRQVAASAPESANRMAFYEALCRFGQGMDKDAVRIAKRLAETCPEAKVKSEATLWLAKYYYNHQDWRAAIARFCEFAKSANDAAASAKALVWAVRGLLADGDYDRAVKLSTEFCERFPDSPLKAQVMLAQGEALMELTRFDEALLVLERVVAAPAVGPADRSRAQQLLADAQYVRGADNFRGYEVALESYRTLLFGGSLTPSGEIVVAFKLARTLEKLKRIDEAMDQYYSRVVLAYRNRRLRHVRLDDDARAAFSKAALRLADEYASRGQELSVESILRLLASSDVPAAEEAARRLERISMRGRYR